MKKGTHCVPFFFYSRRAFLLLNREIRNICRQMLTSSGHHCDMLKGIIHTAPPCASSGSRKVLHLVRSLRACLRWIFRYRASIPHSYHRNTVFRLTPAKLAQNGDASIAPEGAACCDGNSPQSYLSVCLSAACGRSLHQRGSRCALFSATKKCSAARVGYG